MKRTPCSLGSVCWKHSRGLRRFFYLSTLLTHFRAKCSVILAPLTSHYQPPFACQVLESLDDFPLLVKKNLESLFLKRSMQKMMPSNEVFDVSKRRVYYFGSLSSDPIVYLPLQKGFQVLQSYFPEGMGSFGSLFQCLVY